MRADNLGSISYGYGLTAYARTLNHKEISAGTCGLEDVDIESLRKYAHQDAHGH